MRSRFRRSRSRALICCVLLASACAPATVVTPPDAVVPRVVQLEADDIRTIAALLRMEDARTWDGALVERALEYANPEVRGRAALAAGRLREARATPALLAALADSDASVRSRAAFALGLSGDSSAHVIAALGQLALRADDPAAPEAAAALGRLGTQAARPAIDSLLARAGVAPATLHEALLAAWRLPRSPGTLRLVQAWAAAADPETRWRAVYSLARVPAPAAVPTLLAAIGDSDDRVRAHAARGLRAAVVDSAGQRGAALRALAAGTEDPHPHVRINALRSLPAYADNVVTTPLLVPRLREEDANVAIAAAQALGEAADAAAVPALAEVAGNAALPVGLRAAALAAWVRGDAVSAAAAAGAWADSTRWVLRFNAARALAAAPWSVGNAVLERLARDREPVVAAEAFNAIRAAADTVPATRRLFVEGLGSGHALVRAAAARGLGRHAGIADLDLLLAAWERAGADTVRDARMAAVEALGRLVADGVPVERTFFLRFGQAGPPADPVVHAAIARLIGAPPAHWREPRLVPEPRPLSFYADVVERLVAPALAGAEPPTVAIATAHGDIVLALAAADAPLTVLNFLGLVDRGYYRATRWHRVVPNFVIQDGDPRGDGSGGPGWMIRDEINPLRYQRGTLGMALAGPDTGGSQFFITHAPQPHLDGGYTIFGTVIDGMEAVDAVVQDEPISGFRRVR